MKLALGIAIAVVGAILLVMGFNASESFGSEVSEFFSGRPSDEAMWMILGGAAALIGGLVLAFTGRKALPARA